MNPKHVRVAFESELSILPLASLLPTKEVTERVKKSQKYKCIAASLDEVGLVEPLVVYRKSDHRRQYLLLDGHLRRTILMERGKTDAECLLAEDDEAFTYNKRINRLAVVQEHFLIVRAIERGISEEKLAKALDVKIDYIRRRRTLLKGICAQATDLLKDKPVNPVVLDVLRKMKPTRQAEACRLMVSASNYSSAYGKAMLSATREEDLVKPRRQSLPPMVTSADLALMERELRMAEQDFNAVEASYGSDMVALVIAARYVSRLLGCARIEAYLEANHPEMLSGLRAIVATASIESSSQACMGEAPQKTAASRGGQRSVPSRGRRWRAETRRSKETTDRK